MTEWSIEEKEVKLISGYQFLNSSFKQCSHSLSMIQTIEQNANFHSPSNTQSIFDVQKKTSHNSLSQPLMQRESSVKSKSHHEKLFKIKIQGFIFPHQLRV